MIKQVKKFSFISSGPIQTDSVDDEPIDKVESGNDSIVSLASSQGSQPNSEKKMKKPKKQKSGTFSEESIISTLIACDTQTELAPAIKSIFEQKKENEFIKHLSSFIANRELEIERICQGNFEVWPHLFNAFFILTLLLI